MRIERQLLTVVLLLILAAPQAHAQPASPRGTQPDVWKTFASRLDVGVQVNVRLQNGQKFRATLIDAQEEMLLLQPRTRVPVPVQPVPYDAIVSLEQTKGSGGAAKAAAIGVATGVGAFFATMLIILAVVSD